MAQRAQNGPEGPEWPKMAQSAKNGPECPEWPKMAQNGLEGPEWPRVPKLAQRATNGPKWVMGPNMAQEAQNCSDTPYSEILKLKWHISKIVKQTISHIMHTLIILSILIFSSGWTNTQSEWPSPLSIECSHHGDTLEVGQFLRPWWHLKASTSCHKNRGKPIWANTEDVDTLESIIQEVQLLLKQFNRKG